MGSITFVFGMEKKNARVTKKGFSGSAYFQGPLDTFPPAALTECVNSLKGFIIPVSYYVSLRRYNIDKTENSPFLKISNPSIEMEIAHSASKASFYHSSVNHHCNLIVECTKKKPC